MNEQNETEAGEQRAVRTRFESISLTLCSPASFAGAHAEPKDKSTPSNMDVNMDGQMNSNTNSMDEAMEEPQVRARHPLGPSQASLARPALIPLPTVRSGGYAIWIRQKSITLVMPHY